MHREAIGVNPGSSPRMRGTHSVKPLNNLITRIIPADARNTLISFCTFFWIVDHPRGCGEHWTLGTLPLRMAGSSPRMRGTPAGDGSYRVDGYWDHPRGCGEHSFLAGGLTLGAGSSPRMRGTRPRPASYSCWPGIIPADAGNTACEAYKQRVWWDHPRGCGEHRLGG